jgi:hypothetical protein
MFVGIMKNNSAISREEGILYTQSSAVKEI